MVGDSEQQRRAQALRAQIAALRAASTGGAAQPRSPRDWLNEEAAKAAQEAAAEATPVPLPEAPAAEVEPTRSRRAALLRQLLARATAWGRRVRERMARH